MTDLQTAALLYDGFVLAHRNLSDHLDLLNMINVFPIADKDTGSNMEQSMRKVAEELSGELEAASLLKTAAGILLHSGRGNSGTILTLFFEGLADSLSEREEISPAVFGEAVKAGAAFAKAGIENPKPGTILTVSEKAAEAGCRYYREHKDVSLSELMTVIANEAYAALPETANENPELQKYGVIDSGAFGFCMILDAFASAFAGLTDVNRSYEEMADKAVDAAVGESKYKYCTELIVNKPKDGYDKILKEEMERLGDCIIPVTDKEHLKLHIHTNQPEAVLFVASLCGDLQMTKIDNMTLQNEANKEEYVYLCNEPLTKDGLCSMDCKNVFCTQSETPDALRDLMVRKKSAGVSLVLFSSVTLPAKIENEFAKIRYFSDDTSLLDYLFSKQD